MCVLLLILREFDGTSDLHTGISNTTGRTQESEVGLSSSSVPPPAHRLWWSGSVWEGSGLNLTVTSVIEALVSLSRFPWWCHVSQVILDPSSLCTVCLQSVIFVFLGVHTAILLCWFIPYTQHLFPPVLLFLSFLPFSPFKGFFWGVFPYLNWGS